jgi:hypothetical protein
MSGTINASNPSIDPTVKIYDQFYSYETSVPSNEYDVIYGYFQTIMATDEEAENMTVTLFRIADATKVSAMVLFQQIQGLTHLQLTAVLAFYINGTRSPATLLGVNQATIPNFYVARNIRS